jgi:putative exosortase-associated protein (TIGR04073 family)
MHKLPTILAGLMLAALILGLPPQSGASDGMKSIEDSSPQEVIDGMATKGVRGGINIATGWLELPKQVYITTREAGYAKGLIVGPVKGIGMTLVRTVSGLGELATFFLSYPGFYDPWFEPRFVWQPE